MDTGWALEKLLSAYCKTSIANKADLGESGGCLKWFSGASSGIDGGRRANRTDLLKSRARFILLRGVKSDYARQRHGWMDFET